MLRRPGKAQDDFAAFSIRQYGDRLELPIEPFVSRGRISVGQPNSGPQHNIVEPRRGGPYPDFRHRRPWVAAEFDIRRYVGETFFSGDQWSVDRRLAVLAPVRSSLRGFRRKVVAVPRFE